MKNGHAYPEYESGAAAIPPYWISFLFLHPPPLSLSSVLGAEKDAHRANNSPGVVGFSGYPARGKERKREGDVLIARRRRRRRDRTNIAKVFPVSFSDFKLCRSPDAGFEKGELPGVALLEATFRAKKRAGDCPRARGATFMNFMYRNFILYSPKLCSCCSSPKVARANSRDLN